MYLDDEQAWYLAVIGAVVLLAGVLSFMGLMGYFVV
jgi:hypothetical protein